MNFSLDLIVAETDYVHSLNPDFLLNIVELFFFVSSWEFYWTIKSRYLERKLHLLFFYLNYKHRIWPDKKEGLYFKTLRKQPLSVIWWFVGNFSLDLVWTEAK